MSVTIGALRESAPRETRVSLVPEVTDKLIRDGAGVLIERAAGERAGYPDALYKGVNWSDGAGGVLQAADVLLTVQPLTLDQIAQLRTSAVVVGYMQPYARAAEVRALRERGVTSFAMELVPRIARAIDGRAVLAGLDRRLQGGADRGEPVAEVPADADHRRRHHPPRAGARHRCGRGGPAGDRHREASGRGGGGLRRAQRDA